MLDFEFIPGSGPHPFVVCLVAYELKSGRRISLWQDQLDTAPFDLGPETLLVAYSAAAEWSCHLALGWPMPPRCIDLYAEFIRIGNGAHDGKQFPSLISAAAQFGIDTMSADHKGAMRDLILAGGPWNDGQREQILSYCAADVRITSELFVAMWRLIAPTPEMLGGALLRGRYTCAVARMESTGIPIDIQTHQRLLTNWDSIREDLIVDIDRDYNVFDGTRFVENRFDDYLKRQGIPWPRYPDGKLMLDDDTFKERAKAYPMLAPLRELRHSLSKMRLQSIRVGDDGRARAALMPFGSKTGRNQPSTAKFIFGSARWLRSLIKPPEGRAIAYVDWVSQEVGIAAALSGDEALWAAYASGDPYIAFAIDAGLVPPRATKETHKAERQRCKAIVLGVGYGMSAQSIALQADIHIADARELLFRHQNTYRRFWEWATGNQNAGLLGLSLQTRFGWTWKAGLWTKVNPRSLLNWPMQANGAEMMRLACCELTERGIMVCCPVHDALLVEGPESEIDEIVSTTRAVMEKASELVLGEGRIIRTDAEIIRWPNRFTDEAGIGMWERVMVHLDRTERGVD